MGPGPIVIIQIMIINRVEFKYIVPYEHVARLISDLNSTTYSDPHYPKNTKYRVSSIYLDTPDLSFHKMRLSGHPNGYRIRLRTYAPTSNPEDILRYQLDIKAKREFSYKESTPISAKLYDHISRGAQITSSDILNEFDLKVFQKIRSFGAIPVSRVNYERNAFFAVNHSNIRITLDSNIICSKPKELIELPLLENYGHLLEIKNSHGNQWPFWVGTLIKKYNLKKISFSKQKKALTLLY